MSRVFAAHAALLFSLTSSLSARADWPANGLPVCDDPAPQHAPALAPDGSGGAYIAWVDSRSPDTGIYVQRVTAWGAIADGWPVNGIRVSPVHSAIGIPSVAVAPDGAYVTWSGNLPGGTFGVFLQRVIGSATIAPGWPDGGKVIATTLLGQLPRVVADGTGGAIVAWNSEPNIYVQRIGSDGLKWPLWPVNGKAATGSGGSFELVWLAADGLGGAFLTWAAAVGPGTNLFAQHVDESGNIDGGWPADGMRIGPLAGDQRAATIAGDGAGAAIVAWQDGRDAATTGFDIYAQRLTASGASTPGCPADGLAVSTAGGDQTGPRVASDGNGGALIAWWDKRADAAGDAYASRVTPEGGIAPGWPANGTALSTATGAQLPNLDAVVADGTGGGYFCWQDGRRIPQGGGHDIYVQRLLGDGTRAPGWPVDGIALSARPTDQTASRAAPNGSGGAIVAWQDGYVVSGTPIPDIYAARINADGSTPVLVSLVGVRAEPDRVRLEWHAPDRLASSLVVERCTASSSWSPVAPVAADGSGRVVFEDRDVVAGGRYGYRLRGEGTPLTSEVWVDVPTAGFAIRAVELDADGERARVTFSLAHLGHARIDLFDVRGRRRISRDLGARAAGDHTFEIGVSDQPQGVYLLRLQQWSRTISRKLALVR